ncbi:MAG: SDR family NAD(P)-dependent oxidoreductase [Bacteroidota bacterium]
MANNILITGSTDGIGKLAANSLAQQGHRLFVHGRNPEKVKRVVADIKTAAQNDQIHGLVADLSDLDAVRQMATTIQEELPVLDVLINNAGVYNSPISQTKEGLDIRFVVNYFAPFLLTQALIPLLQKAAQPRIINLSSAAQAPIDYQLLRGERTASANQAYAQSKLALTSWSFYLAKQHPDITTIALNPGSLLNTRMVQEAFGHHWAPADKGANIIVDLALSDAYQSKSGRYFDNDQGGFGHAHADADEPSEMDKLMRETKQLLRL